MSAEGSKKTSLIFCDPSRFNYKNDYLVLDVDEKMMETIRKGAAQHRAEDIDGNAYVFGPLYDVDTYDHPGYVEVKAGRVGLVEQSTAKKRYRAAQAGHNRPGKAWNYLKGHEPPSFNREDYISEVQKDYPEVVWVGLGMENPETMHLHFHVDDDTDRVDSIIVDNQYFYNNHYNLSSDDDAMSEGDEITKSQPNER